MADATQVADHLRFWWYEGDAIHFDAPRYARLRGIRLDEALIELRELAAKLLPGRPIQQPDDLSDLTNLVQNRPR